MVMFEVFWSDFCKTLTFQDVLYMRKKLRF